MTNKERGAITLFTVVICMFLLVNVLLINVGVMNKNASQEKEIAKISENYEVSQAKMQQAYQEVLESNEYPTYGDLLKLLEQIKEQAKTEAKEETRNEVENLVKQAKTDTKNEMYPIGSIYISTEEKNPGEFIGGTWERYGKGKTLVGVDENQTEFNIANKEGGQKNITLSEAQLPNHSHSIPALSGSTFAAGKHTHEYSKSGTATGGTALKIDEIPSHIHTYNQPNGTTSSVAITVEQMPSHTHTQNAHSHTVTNDAGYFDRNSTGAYFSLNYEQHLIVGIGFSTSTPLHSPHYEMFRASDVVATNQYTGGGQGHAHTITFPKKPASTGETGGLNGTTQAHTHAISLSNANTSEVAEHTHKLTTKASTTGTTGSGETVNIQNPYITVYMWRRIS